MALHQNISIEVADVLRALEWQAGHAENNGAPCTARVIRGFIPLLDSGTAIGNRMRNWPGLSLEDAMPLRLAGGFHNLHLTDTEQGLGPIYSGEVTDQQTIDSIVLAIARDHDARLLEWFAGPPQTNEAGRSAGIMAQLVWLAPRLSSQFELLEIGASAGINTMMERFAFDLGGVRIGVAGSTMLIEPEWRGLTINAPYGQSPIEIVATSGCDASPINLADPTQALRLKSYVWPDQPKRMQRIDAAIAMAQQKPPKVDKADAADWVDAQLAVPQPAGVTRVLFHSIVWQYVSPQSRKRIEAAMVGVGASASAERPLAWVTIETNRETFRHELRARYWPGGEEWTLLGEAHAHGAWIDWFGE